MTLLVEVSLYSVCAIHVVVAFLFTPRCNLLANSAYGKTSLLAYAAVLVFLHMYLYVNEGFS